MVRLELKQMSFEKPRMPVARLRYPGVLPNFLQVVILAVVQGLAELLPVSSSAHVIVAEKLMGLDPSTPAMVLLLVMLHTGTMFAVIVYFWTRWRQAYFSSIAAFKRVATSIVFATAITGFVGKILIQLIEKYGFRDSSNAEIEQLFGHLEIVSIALAAAGILIIAAGLHERRRRRGQDNIGIGLLKAGLIGAVQGLCLTFRGFSRSGATISAALLTDVARQQAENFSFALAVILTPAVVGREALRVLRAHGKGDLAGTGGVLLPSIVGALVAFIAGLVALKWLSKWLETGRWYVFGVYCLLAAAIVAALKMAGF